MQLEKKANVRQALAAATCAVLSGGAQAAGDWQVDTSILYYTEQDRVNVIEPVVFVTRVIGDDESVSVKGVFDAMTGASPNGAAATNKPQTFTSPSGESTYTTAAGDTPTRSFSDRRYALGVDWNKRTSPLLARTVGVNVSSEEDYSSIGGNVTFARDLNQKLTTFAYGLGGSYDLVNPRGAIHDGLTSTAAPAVETESENGMGEGKTLVDGLVGVTQVLSRRALVQLNYTRTEMSGYLTDPYKIVSVVSPGTGDTLDYVYEKRPDRRSANAIYTKFVYHLDEDVVHVAYRYFQDDWGIHAHTAELQYHFKLGERFYLEPQARYYTQSAADFYRHSLVQGEAVDYASADLRLGAMDSTTVGLKLGARLGEGQFAVRYAVMRQTGDSHPDDAIGVQKQVDLYPTLDAMMLNLDYKLTF